MTTNSEHWTAQQDCRSYRNTGIIDGNNPDPYGNQNAWGIYGEHGRIAVLEEAATWNTQETINANARLIASSPDLLAALEELERETSHAHVSVGGLQSDCAVCRAIKRARAALAEVKGV